MLQFSAKDGDHAVFFLWLYSCQSLCSTYLLYLPAHMATTDWSQQDNSGKRPHKRDVRLCLARDLNVFVYWSTPSTQSQPCGPILPALSPDRDTALCSRNLKPPPSPLPHILVQSKYCSCCLFLFLFFNFCLYAVQTDDAKTNPPPPFIFPPNHSVL